MRRVGAFKPSLSALLMESALTVRFQSFPSSNSSVSLVQELRGVTVRRCLNQEWNPLEQTRFCVKCVRGHRLTFQKYSEDQSHDEERMKIGQQQPKSMFYYGCRTTFRYSFILRNQKIKREQ